jgi:hypothetical protein
MADNTSQVHQAPLLQESGDVPVRLVRGDATPEELAALVAILATTGGEDGEEGTDPAGRTSAAGRRGRRLPWGSPGRMVRRTPPHGPDGWRASALPR